MSGRTRTWEAGESLAVRHLRDRGLVVLARNWRPAGGPVRGELDIVARDAGLLVVCEVKARRTHDPDAALDAVTPAKQARLRRLALRFLQESGIRPAGLRFDVIGVRWRPGGGLPEIVHVEGAF